MTARCDRRNKPALLEFDEKVSLVLNGREKRAIDVEQLHKRYKDKPSLRYK